MSDKKDLGGRPTKMTPETLQVLEKYFAQGFNDAEACLMADIGTSTLYRYMKNNPEYRERKRVLKRKPIMQAKINVNKKLNEGCINTSTFVLKTRDSENYSETVNNKISGDPDNPLISINTDTESIEEATKLYNQLLKNDD